MKDLKKKFYDFVVSADKKTADLFIFGEVTSWRWYDEDVSAGSFQKDLEEIGQVDTLNIHINSCGGDVFEGIAIYNLIKQYNATKNVYIDGIAASIASVIAMAGDNIYMSNTSIIMVHNCWTWTSGNAEDLRKTADDMDKVMQAMRNAYLQKVNITEEKLKQLLDNETYLIADECLEMGFCSEIIEYDEEEQALSASSKGYYDLVMKIKNLEKNQDKNVLNLEQKTNELSEKMMNEIVEKVISKIQTDNLEKQDNIITTENNKQINKDLTENSFMSSFLNKFLEKTEEK